MPFNIMPTEPEARAEAEDYLRVASGLSFLIALVGAVTLTFLISVFDTSEPDDGRLLFAFSIFIPVIVVTSLGYLNARGGYRVVSSSMQMLIIMVIALATFTVRLYVGGSTTLPSAGWYTLAIVLTTVYCGWNWYIL